GHKFPKAKLNVCVQGRFPRCWTVERLVALGQNPMPVARVGQHDPAAIIFTTGSTGPPKGVLYRHRNFVHQALQLRDYFEIRPGGVDVSSFPLFALFNSGLGTTTVFP
ncbi:MAG: AMP-binding protein, partial [Planctomycetales bacterium]|nr:AMP-binding protein [Planctomycetales bacterium]